MTLILQVSHYIFKAVITFTYSSGVMGGGGGGRSRGFNPIHAHGGLATGFLPGQKCMFFLVNIDNSLAFLNS